MAMFRTDKVISAIVLIIVGALQMSGQVIFPLWLVLICVGIMIILER